LNFEKEDKYVFNLQFKEEIINNYNDIFYEKNEDMIDLFLNCHQLIKIHKYHNFLFIEINFSLFQNGI